MGLIDLFIQRSPYQPTYRQQQAGEIMDALSQIKIWEYIIDSILAYLQSPSFFILLGIIYGFRVFRLYWQSRK